MDVIHLLLDDLKNLVLFSITFYAVLTRSYIFRIGVSRCPRLTDGKPCREYFVSIQNGRSAVNGQRMLNFRLRSRLMSWLYALVGT